MPVTYALLNGKFPNYYELLGISRNADGKDIVRAWRVTQLREHPDKAGNSPAQVEKAAAINNAKDILIDDFKRSQYDRALDAELQRTAPRQPMFNPFPRFNPRPQAPQPKPANTQPPKPEQFKPPPTPRPRARSFSDKGPFVNSYFGGAGFGGSGYSSTGFGSSTFGTGPPKHDYPPGFKHNPFAQQGHYPHEQPFFQTDDFERAQQNNPGAYSFPTGCPNCGSTLCLGSRNAGQPAGQHIPCSSTDPKRGMGSPPPFQPFTAGNPFGPVPKAAPTSGGDPFARESSRSPGCTQEPQNCPVHRHNSPDDQPEYQEPRIFGDWNYVESGRRISFNNFLPPASCHDNNFPHNGIKPTSAGWMQAKFKCFRLANEHNKAAEMAEETCDQALAVEKRLKELATKLPQAYTQSRNNELLHCFTNAIELLQEIFCFVASGYRALRNLIDASITKPARYAIEQFRVANHYLNTVAATLRRSLAQLNNIVQRVRRGGVDTAAVASIIRPALLAIVVLWADTVVLPTNLVHGAQDVFFASPGNFRGSFERTSRLAGYPARPFVWKSGGAEAAGTAEARWGREQREREEGKEKGREEGWGEDVEMTG